MPAKSGSGGIVGSSFSFTWSHGGVAPPWRSLLLTTLVLAGNLLLGAAPEAWVFDRVAIGDGELWRLVTGHWVHSDFAHALWDIAALGLLSALFEKRLRGKLLLVLGVGTLGVDSWLWWGSETLRFYCGLSGILNTLLAVGLIQLWRDTHHPLVWLTGLGAAAKICVEMFAGQALLTQTAWPSVPEAHAVGFLCGVALGLRRCPTTCSDSLVRPIPPVSPR
ncbi:MAG: rhombosortase [Chromatiaceae bacterium]|nr:rhombosortase [Gammaproteobacteria bacterium]MCP5427230.1 rhombosortase [Chromatiaceae bacterium]MCP5447933.1 rhombosortase [Chromatiaceae bacterium]